MNKANVWSLADAGDEPALRRAIKKVPSCINVAGWSYAGGRRRGLMRGGNQQGAKKDDEEDDGSDAQTYHQQRRKQESQAAWLATSTGQGSPATVLHFATLQQSMPCVLLALEHGADADTVVLGTTADDMADALGPDWDDIAKVIRTTRRRQHDKLGVAQEDEGRQRSVLQVREEDAYDSMMEGFSQGIVTVTINKKGDGASPNATLTIDLPRYISYKTFVAKVEALVCSRVLLSFKTPKNYVPNAVGSKTNTTIESQCSSSKRLEEDPEEAAWIAAKEDREKRPQFLELKPRTVGLFLAQSKPVCIARPLAFQYQAPPTAPDSSMARTAEQGQQTSRQQTPATMTPPLSRGATTPSSSPSRQRNISSGGEMGAGAGGRTQGLSVDEQGSFILPYNQDSGLASRIASVRKDSKLTPKQRLDKLMKVLSDEEEGVVGAAAAAAIASQNQRPSSSMSSAQHNEALAGLSQSNTNLSRVSPQRKQQRRAAASVPLKLDREGVEKVVERLYDRSLPGLTRRRESYDQYTNNALHQLDRSLSNKGCGEISADQAASVDRLFTGGTESRSLAIAKIAEQVDEAMPKPSALELSEEEVQALGDRLCPKPSTSTSGGKAPPVGLAAAKKAAQPWAQEQEKRVVGDMERHLASIYYTAVEKKKAAIGKVEETYGDFRTRSRATLKGKRLTKKEVSEMGDRLTKRN